MGGDGWFCVPRLEVTINGRKQVFTDVKMQFLEWDADGNTGYGPGSGGGGAGSAYAGTITVVVNPGITYTSGGANWTWPTSHTVVRGTAWGGGGGGGGAGGHVTYRHHGHSVGCCLGDYFPAGDGWYTHPTLERK